MTHSVNFSMIISFVICAHFQSTVAQNSGDINLQSDDERLENIFLEKLGISTENVMTDTNRIPRVTDYMWNRYLELGSHWEFPHGPNDNDPKLYPTVKFLSPERIHGNGVVVFKLEGRGDLDMISKAELVFDGNLTDGLHIVILTQDEDISTVSTDEGHIADVSAFFRRHRHDRMIYFAVRILPNSGRHNHNQHIRRLSPLLVLFKNIPNHLIHQHERLRRSVRTRQTGTYRVNASALTAEDHDFCRLKEWSVSFRMLRLSSRIISPPYYTPNYCTGTCPSPLVEEYLNSTNYAYIKNLYRLRTNLRDSNVPSACCTPIRYADQEMMIRGGNDEVETKLVFNMVVTRCGCR